LACSGIVLAQTREFFFASAVLVSVVAVAALLRVRIRTEVEYYESFSKRTSPLALF
jgi:hypothetical protein